MGTGMVGNKHAPVAAMRTNRNVAEPVVGKRKRLHLDLLGSQEECKANLLQLSRDLEKEAPVSDAKVSLSLSSEHEFLAKYSEMMGHPLSYQITDKSSGHVPSDSYALVEEIVNMLGVPVLRKGDGREVVIPNRAHISYGRAGVITSSSNQSLVGRDCLEYIACNTHEDLAVVVHKEGKLLYALDSSMFEKTPKDPHTGQNRFIGRDLMVFHGAAKTYGSMLPELFGRLMAAFSEGRLEILTIDLRGGNVYTNGKTEVRRFERDHVVPIIGESVHSAAIGDVPVTAINRSLKGVLAYADAVYQPEGHRLSPFEGGLYLDIDCPVEFHAHYKAKQGGAGKESKVSA